MLINESAQVNGFVLRMPFLGDDAGNVCIAEKDMENSMVHKDLSVINFDEIAKVLNADNVIYAYSEYRKLAAERIYDAKYTVLYVANLKNMTTRSTFISQVADYGFPVFRNPEAVIEHMSYKMKIFKEIVEKYKDTFGKLNISRSEYNEILKSLKNNDFKDISSRMFVKLNANKKLWQTSWGCDFSKFGGGLIFMNPDENIWEWRNVEVLFNMSLNYDMMSYCHGTDVTPGRHLNKDEIELCKKIEKAMNEYPDNPKEALNSIINSLTDEEREIAKRYKADKLMKYYKIQTGPLGRYWNSSLGCKTFSYVRDRLLGDLKKQWGFGKALVTPFGTFRDVNEFIRACIEQGAKRINIMSCNPGHYELAKDIQNMPDVMVTYQLYSVLVENAE